MRQNELGGGGGGGGYSLIGETRKSLVYYRCHTKSCPTTCLREEALSDSLAQAISDLTLDKAERRVAVAKIAAFSDTWEAEQDMQSRAMELQRDLSRGFSSLGADDVLSAGARRRVCDSTAIHHRPVTHTTCFCKTGPGGAMIIPPLAGSELIWMQRYCHGLYVTALAIRHTET